MKKEESGVPYYTKPGRKLDGKPYEGTAKVKADTARVDRLKEQLRSTPAEVDFERIRIMEEVYAATQGDQNIMRRAKFMATLLERKKLYIDENLFVGSMAGTVNGIYTYPEWNIDWMKDDNTVEKCKDPEDKRVNQWALDYWEKRALKPRTLEIFEKKYGFDPRPSYDSGLC
jgi:formate C-acetyltransferase